MGHNDQDNDISGWSQRTGGQSGSGQRSGVDNPIIQPARPRSKRYAVSPDFWDPDSSKKSSGLITTIGGLFLVGLVLYYFFINPAQRVGRSNEQKAAQGITSGCNPAALPPNGMTHIIDPSRIKRTDAVFSGLEIQNDHPYPVVAYLTDGSSEQAILSLSIGTDQTVQTSIPVGHYGIYFDTGSSWCNEKVGFKNGYRVNLHDGVDTQSGLTTVLTLAAVEPGTPDSFHVRLTTRSPSDGQRGRVAAEKKGAGFVELGQEQDGHYRTSGSINGTPLKFLVDTGASITAIPRDIADSAGISSSCTARMFKTANGDAEGCVAKVDELDFGSFAVHNVEVAIAPNLTGDALLGMNVLGLFQLNQQGGVMKITLR